MVEETNDMIIEKCPNCKGDLNEYDSEAHFGGGVIFLECEDCEKAYRVDYAVITKFYNNDIEEIKYGREVKQNGV